MTKQVRQQKRVRRGLVHGTCGALVAGAVWVSMPSVALAAPQPLSTPIVAQGLIGLREGAVGADVATVQRALIAAGIPVAGGADGRFGPATRAAVVSFQGGRGLPQSGTVDAATASALGITTPATPATPAPSVVAFNGLQAGAKGAAVTDLQKRLQAAGVFVAGGADGQYGKATALAVSQYQGWNGLTRSGVVDAATAAKLGITDGGSTPATPPPSVATPASDGYVGLKPGARGPLVTELQEKLMATGLTVRGGADGVFGNGTKQALIVFQRLNALSQTGVVTQREVDLLALGTVTPPATPPPATPADPPPASSGNPYVGLAVGAKGQLVKDLQQALIAAGVAVRGGADGVFGNATKTAVSNYQQTNGLGVSGAIYEATAKKLGLGTSTPPPVAEPDTPPPANANPYVGLAVGAKGALVKELQHALMDTGLVVRGGADGAFGNATKRALVAFQSVNGIPQNGVVTEKGAGILNLGNSTPSTPSTPNGFAPTPDGYPKKGESSERVRVLQQLLIDWEITVVGGADGSFGNATVSAIKNFQQTHKLTVTGTITQETADKLGLAPSGASPPPSSSSIKLERFPIQGQCYFGNTWHAPRGGGRLHVGVDIIAAEGNLLYAVVDGTITKQYWDQPGALAGNGLRVAQDNGTYFTYLHMSGFAPGLTVGTKVKAGDVIGFNGNTGNSSTAHLHFEIHPGGGPAVNPYPYIKAIDDCSNTTPQYQSSFAPAS